MAGENYDGQTNRKFVPKNSRAFCDGMAHRASGTALAKPITDNPEDGLGTDYEASWDAGWTEAHAVAGGSFTSATAKCCALVGVAVSA